MSSRNPDPESTDDLPSLLVAIRQCRLCENHLPCEPRPVLAASSTSRILVIGQAPGRKVHQSGIPWDDASGNRLREWMGISSETFYDESRVAIVPMGFCFPGSGRSGDLPPRPECAPTWHPQVLPKLKSVELTLLIGRYAQQHHLDLDRKSTLTETVRSWKEFAPSIIPLPHPSPRNNRWITQNAWFDAEVVPYLKEQVERLI